MQTAMAPEALADLPAAYPGWHIWRGRDSRGADKGWYTTRRRRLAAAEVHAGLAAKLLFAADRHRAREITGATGSAVPGREW